MSGDGEIQRVYYPADEDPVALSLKKILLGTLSSKLVVSDSQKTSKSHWAYRVKETGHEGTCSPGCVIHIALRVSFVKDDTWYRVSGITLEILMSEWPPFFRNVQEFGRRNMVYYFYFDRIMKYLTYHIYFLFSRNILLCHWHLFGYMYLYYCQLHLVLYCTIW